MQKEQFVISLVVSTSYQVDKVSKESVPEIDVVDVFGNELKIPLREFNEIAAPLGKIDGLEEYHKRMIIERAQLCQRINKLVLFIGTDNFLDMGLGNQLELQNQLESMIEYRKALDSRLNGVWHMRR
ncbi:hypothetical protein B6P79_003832 [Escherichia coli]|nr:hypothetical protein [Escherichia coli]EIH4817248.1 hypothetical protein [Escherichia coli]